MGPTTTVSASIPNLTENTVTNPVSTTADNASQPGNFHQQDSTNRSTENNLSSFSKASDITSNASGLNILSHINHEQQVI